MNNLTCKKRLTFGEFKLNFNIVYFIISKKHAYMFYIFPRMPYVCGLIYTQLKF